MMTLIPLLFTMGSTSFYILFIYFEREKDRAWEREGWTARERERIPSRFCTFSAEPDVGIEPTNCEIVTGA